MEKVTLSFLALSVVAPAGQKIRDGRKTIEVRRWQPDIALPVRDLLIVENSVRLSSTGAGPECDSQGRAVALVDVVAIRPWTRRDLTASTAKQFEDGWLAWQLNRVRPIQCAHSVEARLGIYPVELVLDGMSDNSLLVDEDESEQSPPS